jgi:hypothetical protein
VAGFGGIACPSTSACVAVGYGYTPTGRGTDGGQASTGAVILKSVNDGMTWKPEPLP